ncbi:MAG: TIGR00266 family protein [Nitrospirae bacterium]|nr:TIGR00266 family protein [Nitrospirota bacterium]
MKCHEVDYHIIGHEMQLVEVGLDPGETVIAEAGAMNYLEDGITFEAKMGDGSTPNEGVMSKLLGVGKRMLMGESIFLTHFTNHSRTKKCVAFSAPYPGSIIPLNMSDIGDEVICQKDAFLAAALGTSIQITFQRKLGTGFFGGEGFILQKLVGDGMAFMHAGGTVVKKDLHGETLRLDTGCLVAFTQGIDYSIESAGSLKSMFFGGEGFFLATLRGTGTVWIQSLPFSRLAERIVQSAPNLGGNRKGEGSILGFAGDMIDGD